MEIETVTKQLWRTPHGTYVFEHDGMSIHDPLSSSCGRFRYAPGDEEEHSPEEYGFEVVIFQGSSNSAWERRFMIGSTEVVMHVTDASAETHEVQPGEKMRLEVSLLKDGDAGDPLAVWYQSEGSLDETPPDVVFAAPEHLREGFSGGADLSCPNCGQGLLADGGGCVLHTLIQTVRERGTKSEGRLRELHARCDADALWNTLGNVVDSLEDGRYLWAD